MPVFIAHLADLSMKIYDENITETTEPINNIVYPTILLDTINLMGNTKRIETIHTLQHCQIFLYTSFN